MVAEFWQPFLFKLRVTFSHEEKQQNVAYTIRARLQMKFPESIHFFTVHDILL